MAQRQVSVRHHVVPRFLLAGFAETGQLWELDKQSGSARRKGPKRATVIEHYYDLPDDEELASFDKDLPEQDLARIENAAAPLILRLRDHSNASLDAEDRSVLALFLSMMRARTPRAREEMAEFAQWAYNQTAKDAASHRPLVEQFLRRNGAKPSPEAVKNFQRQVQRAVEKDIVAVPLDRGLPMLMAVAVNAAPDYYRCAWTVHRHSGDASFVISDGAIAMFDPTINCEGRRGNGLASSAMAQTSCPLGSKSSLMLRPHGAALTEREASERFVGEMNLRSYAWADRYIYGNTSAAVERVHEAAVASPSRMARLEPIAPGFGMEAELNPDQKAETSFMRPSRRT